jgi:hypothetical protein
MRERERGRYEIMRMKKKQSKINLNQREGIND